MNIRQSLQVAINQLHNVIDYPRLDAEILLAHVLKQPRSYLYAWPDIFLTDEQYQLFITFIARRSQHEPLAYLLGHREFWSLNFCVTPDTLIPRPESELLVESVLKLMAEKSGKDEKIRIADLGTGSGAIALALASEHPSWLIDATDISESALRIAKKNAQCLALHNVSFWQGDWCQALPSTALGPSAYFDVIVSNPPYIAETEWDEFAKTLLFEPLSALVSGKDGLDAIRVITHTAKYHLKPGGYLLIEHGFQQAAAVNNLFQEAGYSHISCMHDLSGQKRVTFGCYPFIK